LSREELVSGYAAGRLSRRVFIRGLVALGVSGGAALAYADALGASPAPRPAGRGATADLYPPGDLYPPPTPPTTQPTEIAVRTAALPVAAQPTFTG
jgi:hypothetical protein